MSSAAVESKPSTGHPIGFFYLFAGEFAERFSYYGMRAILPLYMSDQLGFGETNSGFYYSIFMGMCYFLPLIGGYIADNYFGKYWTIVGFSLPYVLGQFLVGFESVPMLVIALSLLAMGTGVIKPNISTLMGLTYDQQRPGQSQLRTTAFQAFYMSINIGAFLSQLIIPQIRDMTGSYFIAFLVPAIFMVVALGIFALGKKHYGVDTIHQEQVKDTPEQTVAKMKVLGQVALLFGLVSFFWAVFDQSSYTWVFFAKTYMNRNILGYELAPDSIQALNPLFIVIMIAGTFLYKSLAGGGEKKSAGMKPTTKMLIGFLLTSVCMGVMAYSGYQTGEPEKVIKIATEEVEILVTPAFVMKKDEKTQKEESVPDFKLDLPPGVLVDLGEGKVTASTAMLHLPKDSQLKLELKEVSIGKADSIKFDTGVMTLADGKALHFTGGKLDFEKSRELFKGDKLTLDGVLSVTLKHGKKYQLSDGVLRTDLGNKLKFENGEKLPEFVSKSEDKPKVAISVDKFLKPESRVSVWWMALAFLVITVAEILISVTGLELAFVVAPQSMKGLITACWLLTVAIANWFINAPIAGLYPKMHPGNYFAMLAIAGLVVAAIFIPVSVRFNRSLEEAKAKEADSQFAKTEAE